MSVTLQFVDDEYIATDGSSGEVVLDCNDGTNYEHILNTFMPRPADQRQTLSDSPFTDGRKYRPGLDKLESVFLPFSVKIIGEDSDDKKDKATALLDAARNPDLHVVYMPDGGSDPTFYDIIPAVGFDTDLYWDKFYNAANIGVIDFEIEATPGYGTLRELNPLQTVGSNDAFEKYSGHDEEDWEEITANNGVVAVDTTHQYKGSACVQLYTTAAGANEAGIKDTDYKPVNELHHYGIALILKMYSTVGTVSVNVDVECFDSSYSSLGTLNLLVAYGPAASGTWYEAMETAGSPVIYPSDSGESVKFPEGTAYVKRFINNDSSVAGGVYIDNFWFGDTEWIADHKPSSIFSLAIPGSDIEGDLPALADIYITNAFASSPFSLQNSGVSVRLRDISMISNTTGWAVGDNGTILYTTNGGATWSSQTSGTSENLNGVTGVSANVAWAVGDNATILYTTNAGSTWNSQTCGTSRDLNGVDAVDANTAWIAADGGDVLYTTNAGSTWTTSSACYYNVLNVEAASSSIVWAVGVYSDGIMKSTDGGVTWNAQSYQRPDLSHNDVYDLSVVSTSVVYVAGEGGIIHKTTDGGTNWTAINSGISTSIYAICAVDSSKVFVCTLAGAVYYTSDGGDTWSSLGQVTATYINGLDAYNETTLWMAGYKSTPAAGLIYSGLNSLDKIELTSLVMGQGEYDASDDFDSVKTPDTGTLFYSVNMRHGKYRAMAASDVNKFLFNLAAHAGRGYALSAGITFSATTSYDKGALALYLETTGGDAITSQELEDEIDLGDPNTKRKEVIFQSESWEDLDEVPVYLVPDDATLSNINQVFELTADSSLSAVTLNIDHFAIIPTDIWTRINTIDTNCLILNSNMGHVFDSLDGSPSTAMSHDPTDVTGTPRFNLHPTRGVNITVVGINDDDDDGDQKVSIFGMSIKYRPRTKLHF